MNKNYNTQVLIDSTSRIAASYIKNNNTSIDELPELINKIHETIINTIGSSTHSGNNLAKKEPAVPIDQSVFDDYIICLEDGKPLQILKRHIKTVYNLTIEQYKERWGLPASYPVVAPNYAKRRSSIAKTIGLGRTGRSGRKIKVVQSVDTTTGQEQVAVVRSK